MERASAAARALEPILAEVGIPEGLREQLARELPKIAPPHSAWAVRPSALVEDLPQASLAGQYDSVLGVRELDGEIEAIEDVWRSFFSEQAISARARAGLGHSPADGMAVLIQPLLPAECSGVAYSLDPSTVQLEHVAINAAWGLASV